ncbi:UNVERIFIED_CONTAM: hypothetical protein GTU68_015000 [Idotea baltica]|nr:hypothetical protein [Idotea baltica]
MIKEFKEFITRGNVIDLAVAVVIGGAFSLIIGSFVADILNPIIGYIFGKPSFDDIVIRLNEESVIGIGRLLTAVLNFVLVALGLFMVIKGVNAAKKKEEAAPAAPAAPPAPSAEENLLAEIRDLLKKQNS